MQRGDSGSTPFRRLGTQLRRLRQAAKESLAEASGAVEIDQVTLDNFEKGESRPSEDILLLLINHFDLKDDEADTLWFLAGYDKKRSGSEESNLLQQAVMILPLDARIVYTDMVNVTANTHGVVMNFLQQGSGQGAQPIAVARTGMSLEQARTVLEALQRSLDQIDTPSQQKMLPAPQPQDPAADDTN